MQNAWTYAMNAHAKFQQILSICFVRGKCLENVFASILFSVCAPSDKITIWFSLAWIGNDFGFVHLFGSLSPRTKRKPKNCLPISIHNLTRYLHLHIMRSMLDFFCTLFLIQLFFFFGVQFNHSFPFVSSVRWRASLLLDSRSLAHKQIHAQ